MRTIDPRTLLERLEAAVDVEAAQQAEVLQLASQRYESVGRLPLILSSVDDMSKEGTPFGDWPFFSYDQVFRDREAMLLSELRNVYEWTLIGDDKVLVIRPNLGVGVVASVFGCEIVQKEGEMPWVRPLEGRRVDEVLERGVPGLDSPLLRRIRELVEFFRESLRDYPKLTRCVHLGLADNQGPFNIVADVMGRDLFTELYDNPGRVERLLSLVTETYVKFTRTLKELCGEPNGLHYNFQYALTAGTRVCEDSGLLISPEMYERFCKPYNERIAAEFGGIVILLCGETCHVLDRIVRTRGLRGLIYWSDKPQELKDVYKLCAPRKVGIMWYNPVPETWLAEIPTGVVLKERVGSTEAARQRLERHHRVRHR